MMKLVITQPEIIHNYLIVIGFQSFSQVRERLRISQKIIVRYTSHCF